MSRRAQAMEYVGNNHMNVNPEGPGWKTGTTTSMNVPAALKQFFMAPWDDSVKNQRP